MVEDAKKEYYVEHPDLGAACLQKVLVDRRHLAVKDSMSQIKATLTWKPYGIPKLSRLNWTWLSRDLHAFLPIC